MVKDDKTDKPRRFPDNVSLYLNPRVLELAENLAEESGMPLRAYLTEALKYVLKAHAGRLGKLDRYVAEFKSTNRSKVAVWKPKDERDASPADAADAREGREGESADESGFSGDAAREREGSGEEQQRPRGRGRQRSDNREDSGSRAGTGDRSCGLAEGFSASLTASLNVSTASFRRPLSAAASALT